jgi:phospholipid transport system substrate-binding protein
VPSSWAEAPAETAVEPSVQQIEAFHAALLDVMKNGKALGIKGRYDALKPKVEATFDLASMTQFAVGPEWSKMPEADQKALIAAFSRMTIASYAMNFASYNGQSFVVDPVADARNTERFIKSQVVPKGEKPVNLVYRMRETGGIWKVVDVIYESVSQVATRRSDFTATIAKGGAAALVKKLDGISDDLMKGKSQS